MIFYVWNDEIIIKLQLILMIGNVLFFIVAKEVQIPFEFRWLCVISFICTLYFIYALFCFIYIYLLINWGHGVWKAGAGAQLLPSSYRDKIYTGFAPQSFGKMFYGEKMFWHFIYTVHWTVDLDMDKFCVYCTPGELPEGGRKGSAPTRSCPPRRFIKFFKIVSYLLDLKSWNSDFTLTFTESSK